MTILPANESHIPGILALLAQVGQVHHVLRPDIFRAGAMKYDADALREILKDPDKPIFVAVTGSFVAGYCFCIRKDLRESPTFTERQEWYIDDLCVDENCRRQGIAEALFRHACRRGKEMGCDRVTLNVWCGNDSALRFYEKMGLRPRNIIMEQPLEDTQC